MLVVKSAFARVEAKKIQKERNKTKIVFELFDLRSVIIFGFS